MEYICPMCPEVRASKPSSCPHCGMALEAEFPTGGAFDEAPAEEPAEMQELVQMRKRFLISLAFTLPLMLMHLVRVFAPALASMGSPLLWASVQVLLATPVILWGGLPFFHKAWVALQHGHMNMFTLISLGIGVAYDYSLLAWLALLIGADAPGQILHFLYSAPLYFEAASAITTLVLLGQVLELRGRMRTGKALRELLAYVPPTAWRLAHGAEEEIPLHAVHPGDRLRVRPGDRIPTDGSVESGESAVDESLISGEPLPVFKSAGEALTGGTLNQQGQLIMVAEKVGADTALARIVALVARAQRSRAPVQWMADRVSGFFVPLVLLIAFVAAIAWYVWGDMSAAVYHAVAVLVIACPCALGLATPMSITVGAGRGAMLGVLFRDAESLESLARIDTLILDKTGTLTEGRPRLQEILPLPPWNEETLLRLAASLERGSGHPLATSLVAEAQARNLALESPQEFVSHGGRGVQGRIAEHALALGNEAYLAEVLGLDTAREDFAQLRARASTLRDAGATVVFMAVDGAPAGILAVADRIREDATEVLHALRRSGLRLIMLTGDEEATARKVATSLGIAELQGGLKPEDKERIVAELQRDGHVVGMIGDGVNDAPALARAHVGLAMGGGAGAALESAGVSLLSGDLRAALRARRLSRAVMRNIHGNLFFAFFYNLLGLPFAAGALEPLLGWGLNPIYASAAMGASSLSVIANALRLRSFAG